ncbi:MAG: nucleotidyl transferase AbiEii/AbiGii toxin family protein [Patescibacteria group bacterium]|nr:nucleotidyl transferase AbiEii/AbiGii toxin family protein [Patescibacteria group bacterium]
MYEKVINTKTKCVLESLDKIEIIKDFYLAGGTALALQLGHRKSIDLDLFSKNDFFTKELKTILTQIGKLKVYSEEKRTLNASINGVKISFLGYKYKMLFPLIKYGKNLKLASAQDIACMKIDAISSRGSKKDFIDLYFLLKKYSLKEILSFFDKKYKEIKYSQLHILKSLIYFQDAEQDPMPLMLESADWDKIKKELRKKVKEFVG